MVPRRLLAPTLLTALLLLVPGCLTTGPSGTTGSDGLYRHPEIGFALKVPPGWNVEENFRGSGRVVFSAPGAPDGEVPDAFAVEWRPLGEHPEASEGDAIEAIIPPMASILPEFRVLERGNVSVAGEDGAYLRYSYVMRGTLVTTTIIFRFEGDRVYSIGAMGALADRIDHPILQDVLDSWQFLPVERRA